MSLPALAKGLERTGVPSGCPGPTCRQKAHETTRLRAARYGILGTSPEFSNCSNRGLLCKLPVYRFSIAETSCGADDLAFSGGPNYTKCIGRDEADSFNKTLAIKSKHDVSVQVAGPGRESSHGKGSLVVHIELTCPDQQQSSADRSRRSGCGLQSMQAMSRRCSKPFRLKRRLKR